MRTTEGSRRNKKQITWCHIRTGGAASLPSLSSVQRFVCTRHPETEGNEVNKDWSNSLVGSESFPRCQISARDIAPRSEVSRRSRRAFWIAAGGVFLVGFEDRAEGFAELFAEARA